MLTYLANMVGPVYPRFRNLFEEIKFESALCSVLWSVYSVKSGS